jgi:hypothetical protein
MAKIIVSFSRELFIVFVYDTHRCQREEDDPQDAVVYFHPGWVNDQQKLALCGQLMGATQFFLSSFSCPNIIALSSGKFVIRQFGRYIMVRSDYRIVLRKLPHKDLCLYVICNNEIFCFFNRPLEQLRTFQIGFLSTEQIH